MPADLAQVARDWAEAASADLEGLLGSSAALAPGALRVGARDALLPGSEVLVVAALRSKQDEAQRVYLVAARSLACALAAARLGQPVQDFEGEAHDAFVESADLCAGVLGRVLAEQAEGPALEHESSAVLPKAPPEDAPLPAGDYRVQGFSLTLADAGAAELCVWFREPDAQAWFGPAPEGAAVGGERGPIAVIDPDLERREHAEDLSDALGRAVWTLDSAELGPHSLDELRETEAVIVAWDLGGVTALDLLDDLRRDARTADLRIALASAEPTREAVLTALRWGAVTVLHLPLDAGEVSRRLKLA